ncbi:MAG TPA: hypothetical protein ENJ43_05360 [Gammaproteobacteria bacterium]|nr:hypothetical protein [Gammaproteobacteria bacterium]
MEYLPLLIILAILYFLVIIPARRRKKATELASSLRDKLAEKRRTVLVVTSPKIEGKKILQTLGAVTGTSSTQVMSQDEFDLAEKEAMLAIIEEAESLGANAIVGLQQNTGTYEQQGSK